MAENGISKISKESIEEDIREIFTSSSLYDSILNNTVMLESYKEENKILKSALAQVVGSGSGAETLIIRNTSLADKVSCKYDDTLKAYKVMVNTVKGD